MLSKLKRIFRYVLPLHLVLLVTNFLPDFVVFLRFRGWLVRPFLGQCGNNFRLGRNITFYNPQKIKIGSNVYIAYGSWFSADEIIELESEVVIGPYCLFSSSNHTKINDSFRYGKPVANKILIGKGSWIAGHCSIIAGSSVGKGCLVAANSVVNSITDDNSMLAGNPIRVIKKI